MKVGDCDTKSSVCVLSHFSKKILFLVFVPINSASAAQKHVDLVTE